MKFVLYKSAKKAYQDAYHLQVSGDTTIINFSPRLRVKGKSPVPSSFIQARLQANLAKKL